MTKEIENNIIKDYLSKTMFIKDIASKYGVSSYVINSVLSRNNIEKYDPHFLYPQNQRKYPVNDDYFKTQSSSMAYILGMLAADGTVRKNINEIKLTLQADDAPLLEKIKEEIGGRPISFYETAKGYKCATWTVASKTIKDDLKEYGIVPQKTFTLTFPQKLDRKYWIDFIRGYFDGDGSISSAGPSAIRWQLCSATKDVLETIVKFLEEEYDIPATSILSTTANRKNVLYYVQYSSVPTRKIIDILYTDNCLCLERKRNKSLELYNRNIKI